MTDPLPARCSNEALSARLDALRILLDEREDRTKERFSAMEKSVTTALAAAERAVSKAEIATEKRFEGVNEFREQLRDQAATLLPRAEYDVQHKALGDLVHGLGDRLTAMENRSAGQAAAIERARVSNTDSSARLLALVAIGVALLVGITEIVIAMVRV